MLLPRIAARKIQHLLTTAHRTKVRRPENRGPKGREPSYLNDGSGNRGGPTLVSSPSHFFFLSRCPLPVNTEPWREAMCGFEA